MPQHAKRVKIRRKDLRQPDEFETLTGQVVAWADEHRQLLLTAAGVVLVIALGALLVGRSRAARNEAAATDFRSAHELFAGSKWPEAATAFEDVATKYPSAPFGRLARMYRGHALARGGDAAGATTAYTDYIAGDPETAYLRQEALTGLGRAKEASGDTAGALEAYTQAADLEGPFRIDALLGAARIDERTGAADKAREIYTRLQAENPQGDLRSFLASKLPPAPPASPPPAAGPGQDVR
jgi:tetratricopeptide (TPR) repeat protein